MLGELVFDKEPEDFLTDEGQMTLSVLRTGMEQLTSFFEQRVVRTDVEPSTYVLALWYMFKYYTRKDSLCGGKAGRPSLSTADSDTSAADSDT